MSSDVKMDIIGYLWRSAEGRASVGTGRISNNVSDLIIPACSRLVLLRNPDKKSDRSPNWRLALFPPDDGQPQSDDAPNVQGGDDDLPF